MQILSADGQRIVADLATRHGFSEEAVTTLLRAVAAGGSTQAQFDHPEFGGMGQWSQGGMIMIGDMFNNILKGRVDALCNDLGAALASAQLFAPAPRPQGSFQAQSQGGGTYGSGVSLSVLGSSAQGSWWPEDLGNPSSTGAQNDLSYAVFPLRQRLAINIAGRVTVYDTGPHQISGFSQQQSGDQTLTFTSQFGLVRLADLPVIDRETPPRAETPAAAEPMEDAAIEAGAIGDGAMPAPDPVPEPAPLAAPDLQPPGQTSDDPIAMIERLAELRDRGVLTDEEFSAKKAELLQRL